MGKTSKVKYFGSGGASSRLNNYGYSGYKDTEDEWRRPNVAQVYSAEVEEEVKPEGNPLEPYYDNKRTALGEQKAADLKQLDENRIKQRQEAAINNELLMKYLPQLNKASGLTGLGVAQSANVDALSRYSQNVGNIESNFQQGVSDLERAYRSDSAAIDAAERAEMLAEEERLRTEAKEKYGEALEVVLSGHFTDSDDLSKYLTDMGFDEGSKERSALEAYAIPYLKEEGKAGNETSVGTVSDTGDTVSIPFTPKEGQAPGSFKLSIFGETDNQDVLSYAGKKNNGDVFVYGNGIYLKKNNAVYALTDNTGSTTSKVYSDAFTYLKEGVAPDTRPMSEMPNTGRPRETYTDKGGEEYYSEYYTGVNNEIIKGTSEAGGEIFKYGSGENAELYILKDGFIYRLYPKK